MQVSEVMHKGVSTVQINDSIKKVAAIMKKEDIGAVPVFKNERPVGFVTDRDIVISCVAEGRRTQDPISLAMTREVIFVHEHDDLLMASKLMRDNQVSRLLVVDEGKRPVGIVSLKDLARNTEDEKLQALILKEIKR
jgi:CBS domain-containing protein